METLYIAFSSCSQTAIAIAIVPSTLSTWSNGSAARPCRCVAVQASIEEEGPVLNAIRQIYIYNYYGLHLILGNILL